MDLLDSLFDEEPTRLMLDENQEKILSQYINLFEHGIPFAYIAIFVFIVVIIMTVQASFSG